MNIRRRQVIAGAGATFISSVGAFGPATGAGSQLDPEIDLVDDDPRGRLGELDLRLSGVINVRKAMKNFVFPDDCDDGGVYGIDVSHHNGDVPWGELPGVDVKYAYCKASQSTRGKDKMFSRNWAGAVGAGLPVGAYHFLTAGVSGTEQAKYFLKRLNEVGGLKAGGLQPVVDLEWDTLGKNFKRQEVGRTRDGKPLYKDYWEDVPAEEIRSNVQRFIDALIAAYPELGIMPRVYTNRSWWIPRLGNASKLKNCKIWISDYRRKSYDSQQPLGVPGHSYDLWQFSETGRFRIGGKLTSRRVDCNKVAGQSLDGLLI